MQATCEVCVYNAAPRFPSSCRVGGLSDPEPAPPPKKLVGDTAVRVERPFATRLSEGTHTAARSPAPDVHVEAPFRRLWLILSQG